MKKLLLGVLCLAFGYTANAQEEAAKESKLKRVEISCGQCNFGMTGGGCSLAVKMDGKAYFVDGMKMTDFGDPHSKEGLCVVVKQGLAEGEVNADGKFVATKLAVVENDPHEGHDHGPGGHKH